MKFTKNTAIWVMGIAFIALLFVAESRLMKNRETIDGLRQENSRLTDEFKCVTQSQIHYKAVVEHFQYEKAVDKIKEIEEADTLSLEQKVYVLSMLMSNSLVYKNYNKVYTEAQWSLWIEYIDGILEEE